MPVKPLRLREVDGKVGIFINTLLGACRYQADGALLGELLGILREMSNIGTPELTLTPQRNCSVLCPYVLAMLSCSDLLWLFAIMLGSERHWCLKSCSFGFTNSQAASFYKRKNMSQPGAESIAESPEPLGFNSASRCLILEWALPELLSTGGTLC